MRVLHKMNQEVLLLVGGGYIPRPLVNPLSFSYFLFISFIAHGFQVMDDRVSLINLLINLLLLLLL